jgi:hypothetical protein
MGLFHGVSRVEETMTHFFMEVQALSSALCSSAASVAASENKRKTQELWEPVTS